MLRISSCYDNEPVPPDVILLDHPSNAELLAFVPKGYFCVGLKDKPLFAIRQDRWQAQPVQSSDATYAKLTLRENAKITVLVCQRLAQVPQNDLVKFSNTSLLFPIISTALQWTIFSSGCQWTLTRETLFSWTFSLEDSKSKKNRSTLSRLLAFLLRAPSNHELSEPLL